MQVYLLLLTPDTTLFAIVQYLFVVIGLLNPAVGASRCTLKQHKLNCKDLKKNVIRNVIQ